MKKCSTLLAVIALTLLIGPLNAHANLIWDWTGDCQLVLQGFNGPCTHATLHVVTTDAYVPGQEVFPGPHGSPPVLLEARYADANISFDLAPRWEFDGHGLLLPATFPGEGHLGSTSEFFRSDGNGVWRFSAEGTAPDCEFGQPGNILCGYITVGINGTWTRVPEPSSLVLLGAGLGVLAFHRRRGLRT